MKHGTALAGALVLLAQPAQAGFTVPPNRPGTYAPREACFIAPGARAFAAALRGAVARRDARALVDLASGDVRLDFGGGAGRAELTRRLAGPERARLWIELAQAANSGCAIQQGSLVFPWFFAQDLGDVDPFEALLAVGPAVPLYSRGSTRARPIARLNWQLVMPQGENAGNGPLRRVSVVGSRLKGFIPSSRLRSQLAYRLVASRTGSGWRITAFVAGD